MRSTNRKNNYVVTWLVAAALIAPAPGWAADEPQIPTPVKRAPHDTSVFGADPKYADEAYDAEAQLDIYGGKRAVPTPRPMFEFGRPQYDSGPLGKGRSTLGPKNPIAPTLLVYGDLRTAIAYNDAGPRKLGQAAVRLNLDIDYKVTGTERLHAFIRPLDSGNKFTRIEFSGDEPSDGVDSDDLIVDVDLETLFFEGDLGAIVSGARDEYTSWDLPFAVGLTPLLFQNGVWLEDTFTGLAFTVPARNSPALDISNYDVTFFTGFDKVTSAAFRDADGELADQDVNVYGVAMFLELLNGYAEIDYAFLDGLDAFDDLDFHSFSAAFTRRIKDKISTSLRLVESFGQDPKGRDPTADGTLILWENSLISHKPLTLVPYFNFFVGFDRPQSAARDPGAGGILRNTGINFETDNLSGFPKLDDSSQDAYGGAVGVSHLFDLDRQLVGELATVQLMDEDQPRGLARGDQWALGMRYQQNLSRAWILRFDAMYGWLDNEDDVGGVRFELRRKF